MIAGRYSLAGAGSQTAGLAAGGYIGNRTCTEEYNKPLQIIDAFL
jgi:hypothetical protein